MALLQSNVRSCLMWETERPYHGRARKSSYFRLFGEEWYLLISLYGTRISSGFVTFSVYLRRRGAGEKILEKPIMTFCHVIAPYLSDTNSFNAIQFVTKSSDTVLLERSVSGKNFLSSYSSCNWIVFCRLSCAGLTIQMNNETIHLSTVKDNIDRCVQVTPEIPGDLQELSSDFSTLLQEGNFPDFELKCGDRSFPVHRSILASRSEVFQTMFRNRMQESESGSADIEDLEAPVLEALLKFIYSGKLEQVPEDTVVGLYEAADKYAVHCLKAACSYWMKRNLTEENCVSFLDLSDSHSDYDLRAAGVSFIVEHPRVLKSTAWMAYSSVHHELAKEVLQIYVSSIIQ